MTFAAFCPNCGAEQQPGAEFCVVCGYSQHVQVNAGSAPAASAPPATGSQRAPSPEPAGAPVPAAAGSAPTEATSTRFSLAQLIAVVVGVSIATGALAVAITLATSKGDGDQIAGGGGVGTSDGTGLQVVEVDNIRATVPGVWDVVTKARDTIVVEDPSSRALWLRSASLPAALTLDAIQARFLDRAHAQSPDAKVCAGPDTAALPGGPSDGRYFVVCSTFVPPGGGPAVRLADAYYIGLWGGGAVVSVMQLTAVPGELEAFATNVRALQPPVWKLHH